MKLRFILLCMIVCIISLSAVRLQAINLPPEFEDVLILNGLQDPASMAFSPDGRLFFGERITGKIRVAKYNAVTDSWQVEPQPFYTFDVPPERHRSSGLRGFTFDPDFASNGYIYAFYMKNNPRHNRVVRIQADPNNPSQALANSETLLLDLPFNTSTSSGSHNGGDLAFGKDGLLYFTTGDGWNGGDNVQSLSTFTGKLFRIKKEGGIPEDNPFFNEAMGDYRAIYGMGLRNPYTIAVHPASGDLYINEARGSNKADVYRVLADGSSSAANFGHDGYDGIGIPMGAWTNVAADGGKLVTGGAWYPADGYWPAIYRGNYFAALWGGNGSNTDGRIVRVLSDASSPLVETFATDVFMQPGRHKPVMCKIGTDDNLYYMLTDYETGNAQIRMIRYTGIPSAVVPELSPPPGQYDDPQMLSMSSPTPMANIYYTKDGSVPDANTFLYTGPILVDETQTIRATTIASSLAPSPLSGGQYIIGPVPNIPPIASAGPDRLAEIGQEVTLNGAASYDPDGSPLEIVEEWTQLGGPPVFIEDADETVANFTPLELGEYLFQITITDVQGAIDQDSVRITVVDMIPDVLDGLVARWRMEAGNGNLLQDYSDNSNTASLLGPQWNENTPDNSNFSLGFDGIDDWVDIGKLDLSSNQMSITFWFNSDNFTTTDARFISKANGQNDPDHFWMVSMLDADKLRFRLRTEGFTSVLLSPTGLINTNQWIHVAAVYDGTQMRLYVNGIREASMPKSGQIDSDPGVDAALGNQPATALGGMRPFAGLLDEVRIYGRGLSDAEIQTVIQASLLPVRWLNFEAFANPETVQLNWQTAEELDNVGFFIERSMDGVSFQEIGFIPGRNRVEASYTFLDESPIIGSNYYRLRQQDYNGSLSYSPIREIYFAGREVVRVFPNPAFDQVQILTTAATIEKLSLLDISGRYFHAQIQGSNLNLKEIPTGIYILKVVLSNGQVHWHRLAVRR